MSKFGLLLLCSFCVHLFAVMYSSLAHSSDFDGDGQADVLVRDTRNGVWRLYRVDGFDVPGFTKLQIPRQPVWGHQASGDFDGDGDSDVLIRRESGVFRLYEIENGVPLRSSRLPLDGSGAGGRGALNIKGVLDLDGDGDADLLARELGSRRWFAFEFQNARLVSQKPIALPRSTDWVFQGVGDFDGDGDGDVLMRKPANGRWRLFTVEDGSVVGSRLLPQLHRSLIWEFVTTGDFDFDGRKEILLRHGKNGRWWAYEERANQPRFELRLPRRFEWNLVKSGDFDGDGDDDLLLRQREAGGWRIYEVDSGSVTRTRPRLPRNLAVVLEETVPRCDADSDAPECPDWTIEPPPDDPGEPPTGTPVPVTVTSFLNGKLDIVASQGAESVTASVGFTSATVTGGMIFNEFGDYVLDQTANQRRRTRTLILEPGTYDISIDQDLEPAVEGLTVECRLVDDTVTVNDAGAAVPSSLSVFCGTPARRLDERVRVQYSDYELVFPQVLDGPELFSVCLGNGGSDRIFKISQEGLDDLKADNGVSDIIFRESDIGSGVDYVEEILTLDVLIDSAGVGIDLNCSHLGNTGEATYSVIDEPLWHYLASLDVFRELTLSGGLISPGSGAYGNEELDSLISPYGPLIDSAPSQTGVLPGTPTRRLRYLDLSHNSDFDTDDYTNLWRISEHPSYAVGNRRTPNNAGYLIINFAFVIEPTPEASSAMAEALAVPSLVFGAEDIPLNKKHERVYGPFYDFAGPLEFETLEVRNLPDDVVCEADGLRLENGIPNEVNLLDFTPRNPLSVRCLIPTSRVTAVLNLDDVRVPGFVVNVRDSSGSLVASRTLTQPFNGNDYFLSFSDLAEASYTLDFDFRDDVGMACEEAKPVEFEISDANANINLGTLQCVSTEARVPVIVTSYLNGTVEVLRTGGWAHSAWFSNATVSSDLIFDEFGFYVLDETRSNRERTLNLDLLPGTHDISIESDLTPAVPGLSTACTLSSDVVTVLDDGTAVPPQLSVICGTPTKKLDPSRFQQASFDSFPRILDGPELFSVCLGNGGSDRIVGVPGDAESDIGTGVDLVEQILTLPALAQSRGEGIELYCSALGNVPGTDSVIDEPMWRYLVSLDVLSELGLAGGIDGPGEGAYGNAEVFSLLAPYQNLIDTAPTQFGVLPGTPTQRLQFLDFSFNNFNTSQWNELWRISAANNYAVGDTRTSNNFGIIYSFALVIESTPEAMSVLANASPTPILLIDPSIDFGVGEGLDTKLEFPLDQNTDMVFGPFDLASDGFDPIAVELQGVPDEIVCKAAGLELTNGIFEELDATDYTPYGTPLRVTCDLIF